MNKHVVVFWIIFFSFVGMPTTLLASDDDTSKIKGTIIMDMRTDVTAIYTFDHEYLNSMCSMITVTDNVTIPQAIIGLGQMNEFTKNAAKIKSVISGKIYNINEKDMIYLEKVTSDSLNNLLDDNKGSLEKCMTKRFYATKNDVLRIYFLPGTSKKSDNINLSIVEKERKTQFTQDLHSLIAMIIPSGPKTATMAAPPQPIIALNYYVRNERALLTAQLNLRNSQAGTADGAGADGERKSESKINPKKTADQDSSNSGDTTDNKLKKEIITGPKEHWFVAADVRLNSVNQLKYDDATKSLQTKDSPNAFYFSANYMFGDVYADRPLHWWDYFLIKALLAASKTPYDAFGLGVGWRQPETNLLGLSFNALSPFAGLVWTRGDSLSDGIVKADKGYGKPAFIWGLSFNLDVAAKWLSKSDKNQTDGNTR